MTRERVLKPVAPLQRTPDAAPKTRASSRPTPLARLPRTLEAKPVTPAQLEIQRSQQLEVQRQADLEVQSAAIQHAHDDCFTQARVSQTAWHARGTKTLGVQRAVTEHARTARDANHTRAAFVAQRSSENLESLVAQRLEAEICPALPIVQRQADLTLSHVADHFGSKAAVQLAQDPERLSSYAGFKNAGAGLVRNFRTPGSSHTMPELASAIQRFREPMQRAAVESAAYAAFGSHPTYPKQLQRALEERDANLEVQREAWQRELEPVAQRQALEEASGEGAAQQIESARGSGQPLPAGVRAMLETKWNTDLSKVRVHTDSGAASISKKLNAKALTTGQDIFFGASTFNPTSLEGLQLIAHEAWHTVQQAGGLVQAGIDRSASLEVEARGKGSELSSGDLQTASSQAGTKAKSINNHASKQHQATTSSATRAVQRAPTSTATLQPAAPSVSKQGGDAGINVPIDASVDTRKELMVRLLVLLGYDQALAQAATNDNGDFEFGDDSRSWSSWRKPTPEEIKNKSMRVGIGAAEQSATREKAVSANQRFRTGVGLGSVKPDGFRVIMQERLYKRGEVSGQPALVGEPALKTVPVGSKIDYAFDDGEGPSFRSSEYRDPRTFRWYVQNDPATVRSGKPAVAEGPRSAVWRGEDWDFAGNHTVVLEVTSPKEKLRIIFVQRVGDPQALAKDALTNANAAPNFVPFSIGLGMQSVDLSRGGLLEKARTDGRIHSSGSNPARSASNITAGNPPPEYSYSIKPTPGATRFAWRAEPISAKDMPTGSLFGYAARSAGGRFGYAMPGSAASSRFVIASPNTYAIICEEFDAQNKKIGEATYTQVVLSTEQAATFDQWQGYVADVNKAIKGVREGKEVPVKAVFLNQETAQSTALNLYIGPGVKNGVTLLDLTPSAPRIEFAAVDAQAALALFDEANKYPTGRIALNIPKNSSGIPELERNIATDGRSSLSAWADGLGWTSLGLAAAGGVALFIPGGQVAAIYLFTGAAAAGGLSSAVHLADELKTARPNGVTVAVDVLGIASSLIGGGTAARTLRALATGGEVALTKAVAGRAGRYLIITDFALGGAQGILISASSAAEIDKVASSDISREEKIRRIVPMLANLIVTGSLVAYGAKNLGGKAGSVARAVTQSEQRVLGAIPAAARGGIQVVENKSLQLGQVRVASDAGTLGTVRNVRLEFHGTVRPQDVELHLEALQTLKAYEGMSGKLKALHADIVNWVKQNGEPKKLSEAWYAQQEIIKIQNAVRQARQDFSSAPLSREQASVERARIRFWESEIERHRTVLASGSRKPGAGVIEMPQGTGPAPRVRTPTRGLYASIDASAAPAGWQFRDQPIVTEPNGTRVLITNVVGVNGEQGFFERAYNPATQQLELRNAFLEKLPKWVDASVPLVSGKGTPTVTYVTLYQMRRLGVGFGEVKTVKMSTIQNIDAIVQLEALKRQGVPLDQAILRTHSVEYADTPIIQSGQQIVSAKVDTKGAYTKPIDYLMTHFEAGDASMIARHNQLLSGFKMKRSDPMLMNYDIILKVQPLAPGSQAKPLTTK